MTRDVPKKFLDQINVGHDHSSAAVPPAAKLVHSVAVKKRLLARHRHHRLEAAIPIWNPVIQKLQITLPKVTDNLESGV